MTTNPPHDAFRAINKCKNCGSIWKKVKDASCYGCSAEASFTPAPVSKKSTDIKDISNKSVRAEHLKKLKAGEVLTKRKDGIAYSSPSNFATSMRILMRDHPQIKSALFPINFIDARGGERRTKERRYWWQP